jgi:hypothetical protein
MESTKKQGYTDVHINVNKNEIYRKIEDIKTEFKTIDGPKAIIKVKLEKVVPIQPFTVVYSEAGIEIPVPLDLKQIEEGYNMAWDIVNEQSELGLNIGKENLMNFLKQIQKEETKPVVKTRNRPESVYEDEEDFGLK